MLRMLRREREEGLGYGSCVETGECTVPCYVVWRVRELEYYWRSCSVFPDPIEVEDASLYVSRGQHVAGILHLARRPTAHRTAAEKRENRYASGPPRPRRAGVQAAGARCRRA
jgi:hypothetical protein